MAKKTTAAKTSKKRSDDRPEKAIVAALSAPVGKPSALLDTRAIYCGDCLEQLQNLPDACIDLIYIDPPFNSNRNYAPQVFWGETPPKGEAGLGRGSARQHPPKAYIEYMRPRCVELARVLKKTGSFDYHCWHSLIQYGKCSGSIESD